MIYDIKTDYNIYSENNINNDIIYIQKSMLYKYYAPYILTKEKFLNSISEYIEKLENSDDIEYILKWNNIVLNDIKNDYNIINSKLNDGKFIDIIKETFESFFNHFDNFNIEYSKEKIEILNNIKEIFKDFKITNFFLNDVIDILKHTELLKSTFSEDILSNKDKLISKLYNLKKYETNDIIKTFLNEDLENNIIMKKINELINQRNELMLKFLKLKPTYAYNRSFSKSNPLKDIIIKRNTIYNFELKTKKGINGFIKFSDNSIAFKENDKYFPLLTEEDSRIKLKEFMKNSITENLRKTPFFIKPFINFIEQNFYNYNVEIVFSVQQKFIDNIPLLKSNMTNENYLNFIGMLTKETNIENFDDALTLNIKYSKANQQLNKITSLKNRHLINEETIKSYQKAMDLNIPVEKINELIKSKIAIITTSESFNNHIINIINNLSDFNKESITSISKNFNSNTIFENDSRMIIKIKDYNECKKLGSPNWCIRRNENYFNDYVNDNLNTFFIFDFNKTIDEEKSLIGITLYKNGDFYTAHNRSDDSIEEEDIKEFINIIKIKENLNITKNKKMVLK